MEQPNEQPTPEPTPDVVIAEATAAEVLTRFNNMLDELEQAEQRLAAANEALDAAKADAKQKQAEVNTINVALRGLAREMRRGPQELPLFDQGAQ